MSVVENDLTNKTDKTVEWDIENAYPIIINNKVTL